MSPSVEVPREHTWDAESVFATPQAWDDELGRLLAAIPALAGFRGRLEEGPRVLLEALRCSDELEQRAGRLVTYATMAYAVDTTDQAAVGRYGRVQTAGAELAAAGSFLGPELLELGRGTLEAWMGEEPGLAGYGHFFDTVLRGVDHVRSAEVEEVLGQVSDVFGGPYLAYSALVDSDVAFADATSSGGDTHEVTQGTWEGLLASPDRDLRRTTFAAYADGYLGVRNALSALLTSAVKQSVFAARVHRHASSLRDAQFRSNIPAEVFDNLIATFSANLPTWHRYWRLRRRMLGVERLAVYDLAAPIGPEVVLDYGQCVEWIVASLAPLGDEYVEIVRRGCLEERWVDVHPTPGKMGGAFSAGSQGTRPFILMSFDGTAVALGTLAHELGHSLHSYLSWRSQPPVYSRYSMFAAEVASNFHQAMLRAYLLDVLDDPTLQLAVLDEAMANFRRYFFIMPTLARFEREVHERVAAGEGVTSDLLVDRMAALFAEGYGDEVEIDRERVGITWAQFPHLYEPFYVYQYATGISGAHALARGVLAGDDGAADRYLDFLSAGGSQYPLDALRAAGVDLSTPEPVEATFAVLASLVDRLEALADAVPA